MISMTACMVQAAITEKLVMYNYNDILGINGIRTTHIEKIDEFGEHPRFVVECELTDEAIAEITSCEDERCNGSIHKHQKKIIKLKDTPLWGRYTELHVNMSRYRCVKCGLTFTPKLTIAAYEIQMTNRLLHEIGMECMDHSISDVAWRYGVSTHVVQKIFDELHSLMLSQHKQEAPTILGIDEVHPAGKTHAVFTEIQYQPSPDEHKSRKKGKGPVNRIIDMHKSRSKEAVRDTIKSWTNVSNIRYVAIDMCEAYYNAVKEVDSTIKVVIDKRHVLEYARKAMDEERLKVWRQINKRKNKKNKQLKGSLKRLKQVINSRRFDLSEKDSKWMAKELNRLPRLKAAHDLKERFYDMWNLDSAGEARSYYEDWKASIPENIKPSFKETLSIFKNWGNEIFAYFDAPGAITNAYTESANRLIKDIYYMGKGRYRFDRLRARALHRHGYWSREMIWVIAGDELVNGTLLEYDTRYMAAFLRSPQVKDCLGGFRVR